MRCLAIILLLIVFTGCRKQGCTDQQASNYDWKAKKEDGSCIFSGKVSFWSPYQNQYRIMIYMTTDDGYPGYLWTELWTGYVTTTEKVCQKIKLN